MNLEDAKNVLRRRAVVFQIGGFRPSEDPLASWFGRVNVAAAGESWPMTDGLPMHALCQINLTELPFRPPRLEDIDFITVFIGPKTLPDEEPNGTFWCLRAYRSLAELGKLAQVDSGSYIKPFPMRPEAVDEDFPVWDDVEVELDEDVDEDYYEHFRNVGGVKLGGWPSLIQNSVFCASSSVDPAAPQYVFQIDSVEKCNWIWGDSGVGYFARGTTPGHEDEWSCDWQCY